MDKTKVLSHLADVFYLTKNEDGTYCQTITPDPYDRIPDEDVVRIIKSDNPMDTFMDIFSIIDYEDFYWPEFYDEAKEFLDETEGSSYDDDELIDLINTSIYQRIDCNQYLDAKYEVTLLIDTGDGNYDFTLNSVFPAYCGSKDEPINNAASLVWLVKSQGYKKSELAKMLRTGKMPDSRFMNSVYAEVNNITNQINILTVLAKLSLSELIAINAGIKGAERNGKFYDTRKAPDCGTVTISKDAVIGLFAPWSGGGSCMEIELEKDIVLPIRFLYEAAPDSEIYQYGVGETYGMCKSAWRSVVKDISLPRVLTAKNEWVKAVLEG